MGPSSPERGLGEVFRHVELVGDEAGRHRTDVAGPPHQRRQLGGWHEPTHHLGADLVLLAVTHRGRGTGGEERSLQVHELVGEHDPTLATTEPGVEHDDLTAVGRDLDQAAGAVEALPQEQR